MKKNLLEAVMKAHGDTGTDLAKFLGMSRGTFSAKINETNGSEFKLREMIKIKLKYSLSLEELNAIFFE